MGLRVVARDPDLGPDPADIAVVWGHRAASPGTGCATYAATDNEKTVTVEHVARVAVHHSEIVAGRHYGMEVAKCETAERRVINCRVFKAERRCDDHGKDSYLRDRPSSHD